MKISPLLKKEAPYIALTISGYLLFGGILFAIVVMIGLHYMEEMGEKIIEDAMVISEWKVYVEERLDLTFPESIQWEKDIYRKGFQDDYFHAKFQIPAEDLEKLFPPSEFTWSSDEKKPSFLITIKTDKGYDWFDYETLENSMHFEIDRGGHRFSAVADTPVDTNSLVTVYFEWLGW